MTNKLILSIIFLIVVGQLGLLGFSYIEYATRSQGRFFGVQPNNTEFELHWLSRPNVSTRALLSWASLAATATFSFDFVNYERDLENLKNYFTKTGYDSFLQALNEGKVISTLVDKKLIMTAVAIGPAIVTSEDEVKGYHIWKVEIPITVSYLSASNEEKATKLVTLTITEVPTTEASKGIGIGQYVAVDLQPNILG